MAVDYGVIEIELANFVAMAQIGTLCDPGQQTLITITMTFFGASNALHNTSHETPHLRSPHANTHGYIFPITKSVAPEKWKLGS